MIINFYAENHSREKPIFANSPENKESHISKSYHSSSSNNRVKNS